MSRDRQASDIVERPLSLLLVPSVVRLSLCGFVGIFLFVFVIHILKCDLAHRLLQNFMTCGSGSLGL
jgi:hypothetical protein